MTRPAPPFTLTDLHGANRTVPAPGPGPGARPALVCFIKEDCQTCNLAAPVLEAFHRDFAHAADVIIVGQGEEGGRVFAERHGLTAPVLADADCAVSFAWDFEIVPALFRLDAEGRIVDSLEAFFREEWQALDARIRADFDIKGGGVDWDGLPERRPGCGSKHLDPDINDRLQAAAADSPIRARRIEVGASDDVAEFMFDQGFSDGLPLIPPTPERVLRMLRGTSRGAQEIVAVVPPNMAPATVEKIAINAVMAGCRPDYLPVVIAAVEAVCTDAFNIHGVTATTMGASPVMVINGPIRDRIGVNSRLGALGAGSRANATIGRAVRLVVRNVGGGRPGGVDRSTLGSPLKFTMCFGEWEEGSPWEPLHVERGFARTDSVVTLFAMTSGPVQIVDQESRGPDQIAGSLGMGLEAMFLPKLHRMQTDALLVVCPEHVRTLFSAGDYSKARLRQRIQEVTSRPLREMVADAASGAGLQPAAAAKLSPDQLDALAPKFADEKFIHIVVAGSDAGKFSSAFFGWVTGAAGSTSVSRRIETD
ncbi:redoxin domain-containing protein [bacterium]|nr:redoxin domain-containing protein [bacterium]